MSRDAGERERLRALTDGDHGRVGEAAIETEESRRDAAVARNSCSAIRTDDLLGSVQALGPLISKLLQIPANRRVAPLRES
jgi:hypothetical protein